MYTAAALNSMRDGPTAVMNAALTGISGMLLYFLFFVLWLSGLRRGVRSCGCRHGPGCRLGLLGWAVGFYQLFLFSGFPRRRRENVPMLYASTRDELGQF